MCLVYEVAATGSNLEISIKRVSTGDGNLENSCYPKQNQKLDLNLKNICW